VKRFRWVVVGLVGVALAGGLTAGVLARSSAYSPGVLGASSFASTGTKEGSWYWLRSPQQQATWTFDASWLQAANRSYVWMNFTAETTNGRGGCGFGSQLRIVVQGASSGTIIGQLANPWKPHIENGLVVGSSHGVGWHTYGTVNVPAMYWVGARTITVTVSPATLDRQVGVNEDSLHIGYFNG
jgi:hypothetical protein